MVEGGYVTDGERLMGVSCGFSTGGGSGSGAGSGKKMKCDGKDYERLSDHVGVVPMVMVSPADSYLISDAADERRRWLNAFISQLDRNYLHALVRYNAVLMERNRLLREGLSGAGSHEILEALDMQFAAHGAVIHARRAEIINRMKPLVADYYARLSDDREQVEMVYRSELNDRPMEELLVAAREKDTANGFTTSGIHRDDIVMKIGGHPLRRYGSQGQQKSFLVALKLAQFDVVRDSLGEKPILLLDDLFDKLDNGRVERLIELVSDNAGSESSSGSEPSSGSVARQIFISDCNSARLESILQAGGRKYSLFEISNGVCEERAR
jgi:DNA replication and repair protein RecF